MPPLCNDLRSSGLALEDGPKPQMPTVDCSPARVGCPCQCRNKPKKTRYIPPDRTVPFKPVSTYQPPNNSLESGTVYRLSYTGVDVDTIKRCRPDKTGMTDCIKPSSLPFEQNTTFRLSYTGVPGDRAVPYKPSVYRSMMGSGPMQAVTTQRHDYTPKPVEPHVPRKPVPSISFSSCKMENLTTMLASYQPVEAERAVPYIPKPTYQKPEYKLENDTINRLSYQPWAPLPKETYPWTKKATYQQPVKAMEGTSIYRASYINTEGAERAEPYKPQFAATSTITDGKQFAQGTVYRESYQNAMDGFVRQMPVRSKQGQIFFSSQPMSQDTTFRLSYTGSGGERAVPYKPSVFRSMMGSGPMQAVTTQRHDYTPKPYVQTDNFKPQITKFNSEYKMEDTTTFKASYQPNENFERTQSYKPSQVYLKSDHAFESNTINRLSYQPLEPLPKEELPWAKKPRYQQPTSNMDGTSVYRGSYLTPGTYVEDEPSDGGQVCSCAFPEQCSATEGL